MYVDTTITTDGGVFSTGSISWGEYEFEIPVKANPVEVVTRRDTIDSEVRDLAQVCVELGPADLEAYRSGNRPNFIQRLEQKLSHAIEEEAKVVVFKYQDGHDIGQFDMDTMVEIQDDYADIVTAPIQAQVANPICPPIEDGREDLDNSPFPALRSSVENFVEALDRQGIEKPAMGVLPLLAPGHRRQILQIYEDFGVEIIAVDFQGKKPTTDDVFTWVQDFVSDLRKRGELESQILYALNYRKYFDNGTSNLHPSEGLALLGSGFSILGESHVSRINPDDDFVPTNVKAFDPVDLGYRNVPLNDLRSNWPQSSTIPASRFDQVSHSKRGKLKKLSNSESLNFALKGLRKAVEAGEVKQYLQSKGGSRMVADQIRLMADAYHASSWQSESEAD